MSNKVVLLKGYNTGSFIGEDEKFDIVFKDEKNGLEKFEQMLKEKTHIDTNGYFSFLELNYDKKNEFKLESKFVDGDIFIDEEIKNLDFLYNGVVQNFGDLYLEFRNKNISPYCIFNIENAKLFEKVKPETLCFDNNRTYLMSDGLFNFLKENNLIDGSAFCAYDFDLNEDKIISDNKLNSAIEYKKAFKDDYEERIKWENREKQIDENMLNKNPTNIKNHDSIY